MEPNKHNDTRLSDTNYEIMRSVGVDEESFIEQLGKNGYYFFPCELTEEEAASFGWYIVELSDGRLVVHKDTNEGFDPNYDMLIAALEQDPYLLTFDDRETALGCINNVLLALEY